MPIGVAAEEETAFKNHEVELQDGDMIYLFTDGYADQFGGKNGKKFKFKPFRNLLLQICESEVDIQHKELKKRHNEWRGKNPQLDDISIFGFRYHENK